MSDLSRKLHDIDAKYAESRRKTIARYKERQRRLDNGDCPECDNQFNGDLDNLKHCPVCGFMWQPQGEE